MLGDLRLAVRHVTEQHVGEAWPSSKYEKDPILFAYEILGVVLQGWQREFAEAIRDNARVSAAGGRKIGKDFTVAVIALWWYASFDDARVIITAPTSRQIDRILWREIRKLFLRSGRCVACKKSNPNGPKPCEHSAPLAGRLGELGRTGLVASDDREIRGETANEAEGAAGLSGARLMYILDEASAISNSIHTTIRGNLASGQSREVLISNPTRPRGFFYDSHHTKKHLYKTFQVSSTDSPNIIAGEDVVPGLASASWLADTQRDWGVDSPLYKVHVLGQFILNEEGRIFTVHALLEAEQRWEDTPASGRIIIGIDPAGSSGEGDESSFAIRRGLKITRLHCRRGLTDEAHVEEAIGLVALESKENVGVGRPQFVIDRDGTVGARVWGAFVTYQQQHPEAFDLRGVRGGEKATREPLVYGQTRDEVSANLEKWIREGGALPSDRKLSAELAEFQWITALNGRSKVTPKEELKKILGRSPDRADSVGLAAWGTELATEFAPAQKRAIDPYRSQAGPASSGAVFDPYAALDRGRRR